MPDLARRHQPKQGPCRLRCGGGGSRKSPVVEPVTGGILAPAAILILDRQQPVHRSPDRRVPVVDAAGIERAQYRPGTVNVVKTPAAIPGSLGELGPAQ